MITIKPSFIFDDVVDGVDILKKIERIGRTCYKSEDNITEDSCREFIKKIIKRGHESVLEHHSISVRVICDRGVSHEIVRHRLASYSQESTRYCNYSQDKFGGSITFIEPVFWDEYDKKMTVWKDLMTKIESAYFDLILMGASPQEARSVLPNSLKTEIVMTMNLREWRHFFTLRISSEAHPQMREIAIPMLRAFRELIPIIFDNIG